MLNVSLPNILSGITAIICLITFFFKNEKWKAVEKFIVLIISAIIILGLQFYSGNISFSKGNSPDLEDNSNFLLKSSSPSSTLVTPTQPVFSPTPSQEPKQEPKVEFVLQEYTGKENTIEYQITLAEGEIIVGQSWGFKHGQEKGENGGCVFQIVGPGDFSFSVTDGEWTRYKNVTNSEQMNALLQVKIEYATDRLGYSYDYLKFFRIP